LDFKVNSTTIEGTGVLLVSVQGELDIATAEELARRTAAAVSAPCPLVLDLAECSFVDSRGLWSVLQARRELADVGQGMVLVIDRHSQVAEVLAISAVDLSVFGTRDEAIAWFETDEAKAPNAAGPDTAALTNGRPPTASHFP
jgi:anti-anti-sigma factor